MTGTEMLIEAMSRWGAHGEPTAVLLVYTDTAGDVWMKTNCSHTSAIGMAEYAKANTMQVLLASGDDPKEGEQP